MIAFLLLTPAFLLYALVLFLVVKGILSHLPMNKARINALCLLSSILHFAGALHIITVADHQFDFSLFQSGSLIFSVAGMVLAFGATRKPIQALFLPILPISMLMMIASILTGTTREPTEMSPGVASHVLLSIIAYGLITLAAASAVILFYCNKLLKRRKALRLLKNLPPLETTDKLLFELIACGEIFLTLGILTGFIFVDNFFAQHLIHKTVLSIIAWVIFAVFIFGRIRFGWRGKTAMKWTLVGFFMLLLAYAGSKFVLEWLI